MSDFNISRFSLLFTIKKPDPHFPKLKLKPEKYTFYAKAWGVINGVQEYETIINGETIKDKKYEIFLKKDKGLDSINVYDVMETSTLWLVIKDISDTNSTIKIIATHPYDIASL